VKKRPDPERERTAEIIAWFAALSHAKYRHRFTEAVEAQAQLERLGVTVRFRRRNRKAVSS
jgi:hypothetical protein